MSVGSKPWGQAAAASCVWINGFAMIVATWFGAELPSGSGVLKIDDWYVTVSKGGGFRGIFCASLMDCQKKQVYGVCSMGFVWSSYRKDLTLLSLLLLASPRGEEWLAGVAGLSWLV
ncbi:hypothetical protein BDP81DRAFT_105763 [Colletotrichum phormii]|uniref:Uncharacterized protein n=1 Tax=Colletotrichum phormii TaxID=359342 RepID=A0AAI9ZHN3_9PEZI|nr:uncharacterized protein BDP81DRAFT_105763 [Colletotrichum phormii]KAK1624656.1 hypothetical protein BDP81DRAFT_105763 [Colletotrichum phormii]